jgi:hypothetical protein
MTTTLAGFLLLGIAVSMSIASIYGKDETKRQHYSISADVYYAAFILLIGLYCSRPKVINSLPVKTDTVIVRDTIINHAPDGNTIIPAHNPYADEIRIK